MLFAGGNSFTFAKIPLGEKATTSLEALEKADKYSIENAGVGIVIAYGTSNRATADQIGIAFTKEIFKRGEKAKYFYYQADWEGVTIEFYIGDVTLGPWPTNKAAANMSEVVKMMQAAKRVYSDQLNL